jgi:hypothetical protein
VVVADAIFIQRKMHSVLQHVIIRVSLLYSIEYFK